MKEQAICLISLGCPKNLVDAEVMLGLLTKKGYGITLTPAEADIIVINTCSFIREATQEGLDTILEAVHLKRSGSCRLLIVTGCLPQRYGEELAEEMPEVDHFLGTEEFPRIVEYLEAGPGQERRVAVGKTAFLYDHKTPRLLSGPHYSTYIKIAEGCSRSCSFCIVPSLRGRFRSRAMQSIHKEACLLAAQGVKEINLVAQDTTSYGSDLTDGSTLAALLESLCQIDGLEWIRILYAFPDRINSALLSQIRASHKICRYIDGSLAALIRRIREEIPGVSVRTTLMVGFPGETDAQFSELFDFVERTRFERMGVFQFSPEEGTRAAGMPNQVPRSVKRRRFEALMELQQQISLTHNRSLLRKTLPVLIEEPSGETGMLRGRMATQAPEIDGQVLITRGKALPGQLVNVLITCAHPYDLEGEIVSGGAFGGNA
jgi:ribosomal protein S12 methylthiotransferase